MPVNLCRARQNLDKKSLSLGRLFLQYQWSKNRSARFSAIMSVCVGMIHTSDPGRSVIERIQSKPSSRGRGPIKSMATLSPQSSGIGSGCKEPAGFLVDDLFCRQSVHKGMYEVSRSQAY